MFRNPYFQMTKSFASKVSPAASTRKCNFFVLFKKSEHVQPFVKDMNSKHKNISFSCETEKDGAIPFLDVNIFRGKCKFFTNVYRKETFTGVYTNFSGLYH